MIIRDDDWGQRGENLALMIFERKEQLLQKSECKEQVGEKEEKIRKGERRTEASKILFSPKGTFTA